MQYVNMNPKHLTVGGRAAVKTDIETLKKRITEAVVKCGGDVSDCDEKYDYGVQLLLGEDGHSQINKDLAKVCFDTENLTCKGSQFKMNDDKGEYIGFHTLPNGLSYLGLAAGGDWELPLFFIIYWDGKKLRGYIPTYGNTFNSAVKTAFGSEGEYGEYFDEELDARMEKWYKDEVASGNTWITKEHASGDESVYGVVPNWEAVMKDITSRIVVK